MKLPDDYVDDLRDELAPLGLEFDSVATVDGITSVRFQADPESFVGSHPRLGIAESYGDSWPPESLTMWLRFDEDANPVELSFEVFDLLMWAASADSGLRDRLNTIQDPADHAAAVAEALAAVLYPLDSEDEFLA